MKKIFKKIIQKQSHKWAEQRFKLFLSLLKPGVSCHILDLGGYDGRFFYKFYNLIQDLNLKITVADINQEALNKAKNRGFNTLLLDESGDFDIEDNSFDIVFCNSVIEHVTVNKNVIWNSFDDKLFKQKSFERQKKFADEIERISKGYFIQTPHPDFLVESHTWLPFVNKLRRKYLIKLITLTNRFWIKKTSPDWSLLNENEMKNLFPQSEKIIVNKIFGFKKEVILFKSYKNEVFNSSEKEDFQLLMD